MSTGDSVIGYAQNKKPNKELEVQHVIKGSRVENLGVQAHQTTDSGPECVSNLAHHQARARLCFKLDLEEADQPSYWTTSMMAATMAATGDNRDT